MKRILHINTGVVWRGGEQQVHYLFNHTSVGFEHYLFCVKGSELYKRNVEKKEKVFTFIKRFGVDIFSALKLKNICKQNKIDLIHIHDSHSINTYILADLLGMNIPAVIHRMVNFPVNNKWKYKYKRIQKIICLSVVIKNSLSVFINENKLIVINPGIDINRFTNNRQISTFNQLKQELNLPDETKITGIVSALEKEKNINEFIEIAHRLILKNKTYHFVIIGDGSLFNSLKNKHPSTNIHFLGFRSDIPKLLRSLDVFLFTSKNEGYGQVLLETMASKVPIVCNNFAVACEIINNEKTGFIYKDINDAAYKIELLISDQEIKNTITENAFNFVQQFDISLMNEQIELVYKTIFKNG